jgi:hypothetical protein
MPLACPGEINENRTNVPKMPPACPVVPHVSRSPPSLPPVTIVTIHETSPWHLMRCKHVELAQMGRVFHERYYHDEISLIAKQESTRDCLWSNRHSP